MRTKGGKCLGKGGVKTHRKILPETFGNITKPKIRKLARNGGTKKLLDFPYENDLVLREGDIKPFTKYYGLCFEDGILECKDKINITQSQLSWFLSKKNSDVNFKKFLDIWKLSCGFDGICPGLINILDCDTLKDLVQFNDIVEPYSFIYQEDKEYYILLLAPISERSIEIELEQFKKSYSKIGFIEHKIIHNSCGWIRFPTFMKIDNLDGTICFSNIYFKSNLANVNSMCDSYKCTMCTRCSKVIEDVKQELIILLEYRYDQKFSIV